METIVQKGAEITKTNKKNLRGDLSDDAIVLMTCSFLDGLT